MPCRIHTPLDILAFGAHPDDVELSAGGTLIQSGDAGEENRHRGPHKGRVGHPRLCRACGQEKPLQPPRLLGLSVRENLGAQGWACPMMSTTRSCLDWRRFAGIGLGPFWPMRFMTATPTMAGRRSWCTALAFWRAWPEIETAESDGPAARAHARACAALHPRRFREPSIVVDITGAEVKQVCGHCLLFFSISRSGAPQKGALSALCF